MYHKNKRKLSSIHKTLSTTPLLIVIIRLLAPDPSFHPTNNLFIDLFNHYVWILTNTYKVIMQMNYNCFYPKKTRSKLQPRIYILNNEIKIDRGQRVGVRYQVETWEWFSDHYWNQTKHKVWLDRTVPAQNIQVRWSYGVDVERESQRLVN